MASDGVLFQSVRRVIATARSSLWQKQPDGHQLLPDGEPGTRSVGRYHGEARIGEVGKGKSNHLVASMLGTYLPTYRRSTTHHISSLVPSVILLETLPSTALHAGAWKQETPKQQSRNQEKARCHAGVQLGIRTR